MLAWKSGPLCGPQNFSSRATFGSQAMGCTSCFMILKNRHRFPYLKAAAWELMCMTVTLAALEQVFGVAAPIRVARSTSWQGVKSSLKKSRIPIQGAKKRPTIFSKFVSSYRVVWTRTYSNLLNGNVLHWHL